MKQFSSVALTLLVSAVLLVSGTLLQAQQAPGAGDQPKQEKAQPAPIVTLEGTVKDTGAMATAAIPTCTLTTEKETVTLVLAPSKYLEKIGLKLQDGQKVSVTGAQFTRKEKSYVQVNSVTIDAKTYTLRDEKGRQQWSTLVEMGTAVTLEGTVKDVKVPEAKQKAGADGAPAKAQPANGLVTFTLTTDKESYTIQVSPNDYLTQLGLTLKEGDKLSLTGWQMSGNKAGRNAEKAGAANGTVFAREITANGKTYTLRDAEGKAAWQAAGKEKGNREGRALDRNAAKAGKPGKQAK